MKKDKIAINVMQRVIKYEKDRSYHAIEILSVIILGFASLLVVISVDVLGEMNRTGASDLIGMLMGDFELAKEYWSIIIETVSYEFPWFRFSQGLVLMFPLLVTIHLLRKRLRELKKKWEVVREYLESLK